MEPDTDLRVVAVSELPTGDDFDRSMRIVNGISISSPLLNIIVQFKVTKDPTGWTGLDALLDNNTEV